MKSKNRYAAIIERIFNSRFKPGTTHLDFKRDELVTIARQLRLTLPKNLGDLIYSFRYRSALPKSIQAKAGPRENLDHPPDGPGQIPICPRAGYSVGAKSESRRNKSA